MGMGYGTKLYVYRDHMKRFEIRKIYPGSLIETQTKARIPRRITLILYR
ncbi:MAG: hypothetical protein QOF90_1960 [Acetobacteraceae bacterium]|jgi:hypothetical protein|nr:hypothetical protein [Acetobacteraceae bacterium]